MNFSDMSAKKINIEIIETNTLAKYWHICNKVLGNNSLPSRYKPRQAFPPSVFIPKPEATLIATSANIRHQVMNRAQKPEIY